MVATPRTFTTQLTSSISIPVIFHILHKTDGTGNVSDSQIQTQLDSLNYGFRGSGFSFYLAAIDRISDNDLFYCIANVSNNYAEDLSKATDISSQYDLDPAHVLNIYIGSGSYKIEVAQGQYKWFTVLGSTNEFPWEASEDSKLQGVFIDYNTLPGGSMTNYDEGNTAVHEVGHYVGLYHTFQNGCSPPGDYVNDTPYKSSPAFGCPEGRNSCPDQPGNDPIHNYMDYSNDPCMYEFTPGQYERAASIVAQYKPSLGGTTIDFNSNFSISGNESYKFEPGITLEFNSGFYLIINGTLNAVGASNNKITFDFVNKSSDGINFQYGSGGTLKYCNIKNGYDGIYINTGNANPSIQYCNISNNNYGIYFQLDAHNYVNSVSYNTIENNTYDGIYMDDAGQPQNINNNTIQYNGRYGIYCAGYNDPDISFNSISNNSSAGIYLVDYSTPDIHDNSSISNNSVGIKCNNSQTSIYRNGIESNSTGIFGTNSSNINISDILLTDGTIGLKADYSSTIYANLSSIYGYADAGDYALYANHSSTINAPNNCWDQVPPSMYTANGGSISWQPGSTCSENNIALSGKSSSSLSLETTSSANNSSYDEDMQSAFQYIMNKKYENAITIYHKKFNKVTDLNLKKYILNQLAFCYKKMGRNDFVDFLNNEVRTAVSNKSELYALTVELENSFLVREGKYDKVLNNLDFLKTNFSDNDEVYKNALFGLVHLAYGYSKDTVAAENYLAELKNKYPSDELTHNAEILLKRSNGNASQNMSKGVAKKEIIKETPKQYALLGNYPNPFNPTTTIIYDLPRASEVSVTIYNVLGSEVKTFHFSSQSAGRQHVVWNGTNNNNKQVASGVYLYHFKAEALTGGSKVFEKTAKLILMK